MSAAPYLFYLESGSCQGLHAKPQPFVMCVAPCSSPPPYSGVKLAPLSPFTTAVLASVGSGLCLREFRLRPRPVGVMMYKVSCRPLSETSPFSPLGTRHLVYDCPCTHHSCRDHMSKRTLEAPIPSNAYWPCLGPN